MPLSRYAGQLDNVDPVAFGAQLFHDGKTPHDNDPTDCYLLDDPHTDFLMEFFRKMEVGWYRARKEQGRQAFLAQLSPFQANLPDVGKPVWVEFPNVQGVFHACVIEFIPPERDQALIRMLDNNKTEHPEQSPLRLVGYEYPGRFPVFYTQNPTQTNKQPS